MSYFFADHPAGRDAAAERFFSILMRARIAMGMPALVAREGDRLLGGAMGYTAEPPDWPHAYQQEWDAFEHSSAQIKGEKGHGDIFRQPARKSTTAPSTLIANDLLP